MTKKILRRICVGILCLAMVTTLVVPYVSALADNGAEPSEIQEETNYTKESIYSYFRGENSYSYKYRMVKGDNHEALTDWKPANDKNKPLWYGISDNASGLIPLYELYNSYSNEYFYTNYQVEADYLSTLGWEKRGDVFTYVLSTDSSEGTDIYRLYNGDNGIHYFTPDENTKNHLVENGWSYEGVVWKAFYDDTCESDSIPEAILVSHSTPWTGDGDIEDLAGDATITPGSKIYAYFRVGDDGVCDYRLVSDKSTADMAGWSFADTESKPVWSGSESSGENLRALYELYNSNAITGAYFYTVNDMEALMLCEKGWTYNGILTYVPESSDYPMYRLYNPDSGIHYFTPYEATKNRLTDAGWYDEGIKFYISQIEADSTPDTIPSEIMLVRQEAKVTKAPIANTEEMTYDGYRKVLINDPGACEGGTLRYTLTPENPNSWVSDFNYVTAVDTGIYKLYYKVVGDETHYDSDIDYIEVTISRADNEFTGALVCDDIYVDGTPQPTGLSAKYNNDSIIYRYSNSENGEYRAKADVTFTEGKWYVKAYVPQTDYYNAVESDATSFTVKKGSQSGGSSSSGGGSAGGSNTGQGSSSGGSSIIPTPIPTPEPEPDPEPNPDPAPTPSPAPTTENPQPVEEYTDSVTGEVDIDKVEVPLADEVGTVIEKEDDGSVTVRDDRLGEAEHISPAVFAEGHVYRLYNPHTGEHFYTKNPYERNALARMGWSYEADQTSKTIASTEDGAAPVYRVYNPNSGLHHYTTNREEAYILKTIGWAYEGISMYAYMGGAIKGTPTYRVYCPFPDANGHNQHIYTTSLAEKFALMILGYIDEGIAWHIK